MAQCGGDCLRYKDRVIIVTGGAMGIGKGIVQVFVRHGSKVVIADINETVGKEAEKAVNETGPGEAMFVRCDVTKEDDVVVCLPHLRKVKGNMINIASVSGIFGGPRGLVSYNTTKAASMGFTKSLAAEEGPIGVRVNGVAPGSVATELLKKVMEEDFPAKTAAFFYKECNVMGRLGQPEEIGMACLFLAADATYSTGAILNGTGGSEIDYGVKTGPNHYSSF